MKICHIITRMIVGGAQENTLLTVRGLHQRGHDVTLLTGPTEGPEGRLLDSESVEGVRLVEEADLVRPLAPVRDLRAWRRLRRFFHREQFDVVHTHSSKAGIIGRFAAWGTTPLIVHTVHGQPFHSFQSRWLNWFYILAERAAARRCHHICAVAQAMVDQAVAAEIGTATKYSVVYSGMELEPYLSGSARNRRFMRRRLGIAEDAPVIGKVARFFELKGHEYLIAAAPEIVRQFPETRFLLVGDGVLRRQIEWMVRDRGLMDNFVFTGLVPPSEIPDYIGAIDVLAHLSLREGLPRTVVQGFAAGKPALAFELDGTPEVVLDGETGFLCPPRDVACVSQGLLRLLQRPELARQMGLAGQKLVRNRFDWRRMVEKLEDLYRTGLVRETGSPLEIT